MSTKVTFLLTDFLAFKAVLHTFWRRLTYPVRALNLSPWTSVNGREIKFLVELQDLKSAEPVVAQELMAQRFVFAGRIVERTDRNPFAAAPPTRAWMQELLSFSWMRHLMFGSQPEQVASALKLTQSWLLHNPASLEKFESASSRVHRVINLVIYGEKLLSSTEASLRPKLISRIYQDLKMLHRLSLKTEDLNQLRCLLALAYAGQSIADIEWLMPKVRGPLSQALISQVINSGGPIDRNPATLLEISLLLMNLTRACQVRGKVFVVEIEQALDLCLQLLSLVRLGDGGLTTTHGAPPTAFDDLAILAETSPAARQMPPSINMWGFSRLSEGRIQIVADTGPSSLSDGGASAHASALAFEATSGQKRLIINCGTPKIDSREWNNALRQSSAHSGVTLNGMSSAEFTARRGNKLALVKGPDHFIVENFDEEDGPMLRASHDGYDQKFGIVHERRLQILLGGKRLAGQDFFHHNRLAKIKDPSFQIRFHLPPEHKAHQAEKNQPIFIDLGGGEIWEFSCSVPTFGLQESVAVGRIYQMVDTKQILVEGKVSEFPRVIWSFLQHSLPE